MPIGPSSPAGSHQGNGSNPTAASSAAPGREGQPRSARPPPRSRWMVQLKAAVLGCLRTRWWTPSGTRNLGSPCRAKLQTAPWHQASPGCRLRSTETMLEPKWLPSGVQPGPVCARLLGITLSTESPIDRQPSPNSVNLWGLAEVARRYVGCLQGNMVYRIVPRNRRCSSVSRRNSAPKRRPLECTLPRPSSICTELQAHKTLLA